MISGVQRELVSIVDAARTPFVLFGTFEKPSIIEIREVVLDAL